MPIIHKGFRIQVGQTVNMSLWHGDNAPEQLDDWTGQVLERRKDDLLVEYVIQRTWDAQKVLASRDYILNVLR